MNKFINFPNGDSIAADCIKAVRLGNFRPKGENAYESELKSRVIVDFTIGRDHSNCIILNCDSDAERDVLAKTIREQLA